jgi:hypothetical protein
MTKNGSPAGSATSRRAKLKTSVADILQATYPHNRRQVRPPEHLRCRLPHITTSEHDAEVLVSDMEAIVRKVLALDGLRALDNPKPSVALHEAGHLVVGTVLGEVFRRSLYAGASSGSAKPMAVRRGASTPRHRRKRICSTPNRSWQA